MSTHVVGYEFVRRQLDLPLPPATRHAQVGAVTRVERMGNVLVVPRSVAPQAEASTSLEAQLLSHLLFALRYEGTHLAILRDALSRIPAETMVGRLAETPSGAYIRVACFLWESYTGLRLPVPDRAAGSYEPIFDPALYFTPSSGPTSTRWRTRFNGIGTLDYCVTVERTSEIEHMLAHNVLDRLNEAVKNLGADLVRRTLEWAYLSETEGSFAIEGENPPQNKAQAFVSLLREAHEKRPLSEEYLCELQRAALANAMLHEVQFRTEQNWLRRGGHGALSVTYVPPPPELAFGLMEELIGMANLPPAGLDPLITAAAISFGFVFVHPFMDGNGRLSRFLIHHTLCCAGALDNGFVLPISAAIHRNEEEYLKALSTFSSPVRQMWRVIQIDEERFDCQFEGSASIYRYWDATQAVAFILRMARQAVDIDLLEEAHHLQQFDKLFAAVSAEHDVRSNDLATLVTIALKNRGISSNKRKRYAHRVPTAAMDMIEAMVRELNPESLDSPPAVVPSRTR